MSMNGDNAASPSAAEVSQRPKLNLKPRDQAAVAKLESLEKQHSVGKANPFGAAKPREAILAERTGKSEEEILRDAVKAERGRLRLNAQQLEEKAALDAAVDEIKQEIEAEADQSKRAVLQEELATRQQAVEQLLDKFEKLALEAVAKGEITRPSERRREQAPAAGRGYGDSEAGFGNGFAARREEPGRGGFREGGYREGGYREGGFREGGYREGGDRQGARGGYREAGRDAAADGHRRQYEPSQGRGGHNGHREDGYRESQARSDGGHSNSDFGDGYGNGGRSSGGRGGYGGRGGGYDNNRNSRNVPGLGPLPGMEGPLPGMGGDDYRRPYAAQDRF